MTSKKITIEDLDDDLVDLLTQITEYESQIVYNLYNGLYYAEFSINDTLKLRYIRTNTENYKLILKQNDQLIAFNLEQVYDILQDLELYLFYRSVSSADVVNFQ